MKRFLLQILLGASLIVVLLIGVAVWRLRAIEQVAKKRFSVDGACPILVLGDSHADSSFCEGREFGIWVAGHHSTPLNFSLMRLKEIERRGGLRGVKTCIVNFCYTTTGAKTQENQLLSAWYFFPYCLRYREWIPVSNRDLACYLTNYMIDHPMELPTIAWSSDRELPKPSILEHTQKWVDDELALAVQRHFSWRDPGFESLPSWKDLLLRSMKEFKAVCDRNGIRLLFYTSPLSEAYRASVPEWAKANLDAWVLEARKLGIEYYDFSSACGPEMLRDSNHVRRQCSKEFVQRFLKEVFQCKR